MIDLKQAVKAAQQRVEAAKAERLKKEEEARQLRIELAKVEQWLKIKKHVQEIQKYLEDNSSKGYREFRYHLADNCPDFKGFYYNYTINPDSPTDLLIRYLRDAGLTVKTYWRDEPNYSCGEDWVSTGKHWLEIRF